MLCDLAAGWLSGMVAVAVGHPFDTIKVRQQVRNISTSKAVQGLIKQGGYGGLYRGLSFPFITNGILNSAFFGVYGPLTDLFVDRRIAAAKANDINSVVAKTKEESFEPTYTEIFLAGSIAGFLHSFLATPIDLIKIKLQATAKGDKNYFSGPVDAIQRIHRTSGIKGYYQGFWSMTLREIPGSSIWITTYEMFKNEIPCPSGCSENFKNFISGGIAGIACWAVIMPIDVVKSKLQADCQDKPIYRGMTHCALEVWRERGVRGFYRGFLSASARAFPVNAASLLTYQLIVGQCKVGKNKGLSSGGSE